MQKLKAYFSIFLSAEALAAVRDGRLIKPITERIYDFLRLGGFNGVVPVLLRVDMRPHKGDWRRIRARALVGAAAISEDRGLPISAVGDSLDPVDCLISELADRYGVRLAIYFEGRAVGFLRTSRKYLPTAYPARRIEI